MSVVLPISTIHEIFERSRVAVVQQVAGALPAENAVVGIAPGRAVIIQLAHEKAEVKR